MGGSFSLEKHGIFDQERFDRYIASGEELHDLSEKVVAITGTTTGSLGYFVAKAAVAKKAKLVLLLNRDSERAKKTEEDIKEGADPSTTVKTVTVDLLSFESVEKAAKELNEIASENGGLDVLCNNAGIMAQKDTRSKDGFDIQMQANQLSHVLLMHRCMASLEKAAESRGEARVVFHSSSARHGIPLEERYFEKCEPGTLGGDEAYMASQMIFRKDGPWARYHQTKLANVAFAMELHERLQAKNSKIKAIACDPGWSHSNLQTSALQAGNMPDFSAIMGGYVGQSAADGSLPCVMACFGKQTTSGDFYLPDKMMKGDPIKSIEGGKPIQKNGEKAALNPENKKLVWETCEKVLGIKLDL